MADADGYGERRGQDPTGRLLEDLRTFGTMSIERVAAGWDKHEASGLERLHEAEKSALKALEDADQAPGWEDLKRQILDQTEGRASMVAWRAEHGEAGHKAERAALAAALALTAAGRIDNEQYRTLAKPMAEALPWLLLEEPPS